MDYEKLHKETLERLQQRVREGKMTEEVAKYICPDFVAESEDERIRKWISDILDESNWRKDWPYTKQQVINYLEKQKDIESKYAGMVVVSQEEWDEAIAYAFKLGKEEGEKQKDNKFAPRVLPCSATWFEDGEEKQKEQKPLSSEETELNSIAFLEQIGYTCIPPGKEQKSHLTVKGKGVYKICPHCKSRMIRDDSKVYTSMPPQYGYNCPKCGTMEFDTTMYDSPEMKEQQPALRITNGFYEPDGPQFDIVDQKPAECIEFDNEFKNQVSHLLASVLNREWEYNKEFVEYTAQQLLGYAKHEISPAEWSEEDKKTLNGITNCLCVTSCDIDGFNEWYDWLKDLPERFNLPPKQEWSEDDEDYLIDVKNAVYNYFHEKYAEEVWTWLEPFFCRPKSSENWKPSEEQLKALNAVANDGVLLDLFNDLLKLL